MKVELISVWKDQKKKGTYVPFHSHEYYELVYYPFGKGESTVGEEAFAFSTHSFALIPPGVWHDERHDEDGSVLCLIFSVKASLKKGIRNDALNTIGALLEEILTEAQNQKYGYEDMINARLCELTVLLLRDERKTMTEEKDFGYIINYLRENYHEKLILRDCARHLNISYDYFQHRFKRITGLSPRRFLLLRRLYAAEQLLKTGGLDCTEIAYRCGFSTSAQFSALFKREYGKTPLQYRKAE